MADVEVAPLVARLTGHLQALDWHDASMAHACQAAGESLSSLCGICAGGLAGDLSHWDQAAARLDLPI